MNFSKKIIRLIGITALFMCLAGNAFAMKETYNYMSPASLHNAVATNADVAIVDIQVADEFKAHHIKGAIETNAYPVKSTAETDKLNAAFSKLKDTAQPIVVICPRGKGGAERAVQYLAKKGIAPYRLFILTNGQGGWPFEVESE
ncbi:rhodanese-like domain-containing protein [Maridesulfovibrio sp.]|jgi:thiosulfate/3-mercaptopyruvate sulfurtransferase|uniref:rhodanese-like domain-containing protein n=1 Tax=Maridesulfovibrio sp. TaxID=2795000 RepID=UPI0029CA3B2A|nr:rhodanese-like domain-containing protein [Maridesulfovibrio sp.]